VKVTWPLRAQLLAAAGQAAGGPPAQPPAATGPASPPAAADDAAWAAALGVAPELLLPAEPDLDDEEAGASALVRFHYFAHRPEAPAFPRVALRLMELLLEEEPEVQELSRLVGLDAALAGAVLARANAAAGRALDPIQTVGHAMTRLGLSEVTRVAAATAIRALYDERMTAAFGAFAAVWPGLFQHGVASGRLAADLARGRPGLAPDQAFAAGLLHDVGLAVALRSLAALTLDGTLPRREPASALRVLRQAHREIGEDAARAWRLPVRLLEAVADHHAADLEARPALVRVVALASALDLCGEAPGAADAQQAAAATRALGESPAFLAAALVRRGEAVAWARRSFSLL
jgi:HD-like signal output (HDOD) protein